MKFLIRAIPTLILLLFFLALAAHGQQPTPSPEGEQQIRALRHELQRLPTRNISPAPKGREHIFDTYATWSATPKLTLVGEADHVLNRTVTEQPSQVLIGSVTARYALARNWTPGARGEYFDSRVGLFSGTTQALNEVTFIADHLFTPGSLARAEYRHDFSNQRFFLTDTAGVLVHAQTTATLGLAYWWGTKQGSW